MKREISRKEIFQREIQTGATIEEVKIYVNSLQLILAVGCGREYVCINHQWIFSDEDVLTRAEKQSLIEEIKDLKKKIKKYERAVQNVSKKD